MTKIQVDIISGEDQGHMKQILNVLIERGNKRLSQPRQKVEFTGNEKADALLNDLEEHSHAFVLACVMDRQIKAERAWLIPYEISKEIGGFEFSRCLALKLEEIKEIFKQRRLHRFNDIMAENFYLGLQKIHENYNDDVSNIWKKNPGSAAVVRRFLQFHGVGVKIATMATNILARDFKIPMADKICIDVSPDVHVRRVFSRLGFINKDATNDEIIHCAKELNPEYPGIFDLSAWKISRTWCRPKEPDCRSCYLETYCPKIRTN